MVNVFRVLPAMRTELGIPGKGAVGYLNGAYVLRLSRSALRPTAAVPVAIGYSFCVHRCRISASSSNSHAHHGYDCPGHMWGE